MSIFSPTRRLKKSTWGASEMEETVIRAEPWEARPRLAELGTSREQLMNVVDIAIGAANVATGLHCTNAGGTFAYQNGVFGLRSEHIGGGWEVDRSEGVEGIIRYDGRVRILFSNVDICCLPSILPKPRSKKGAGSERVCQDNLFASLPHMAPKLHDDSNVETFYLLVDSSGRAELSRPVIVGEVFKFFVERIFLGSLDDDEEPFDRSSLDDDDAIRDFDVSVVRKRA